jgi:hypothetical protein
MKRTPVIHPFLFALSPILFLYSYNLSSIPVNPGELVLPVLLALGATAVLWLLLALILRDQAKAGLLATLVVALGSSYGHVYPALTSGLISHGYLLVLWLLLLGLGSLLVIRTRRSLRGLTTVLNVVSAAALATNVVTGVPALVRVAGRERAAKAQATATPAPRTGEKGQQLPDIYYVILDEYVRSDIMKANFGYDNSDFVDYLIRNGFYVVPRARSNYVQTYLSLASSLNATYLDSLVAVLGTASKDRAPLIRLINHSRVVEFLKRHGYTAVCFSSGYTGTDLEDADVLLKPRGALSEFQNVLLATTVIPAVLSLVTRQSQADRHRERILYTLNGIPRAARGRRPAFVFAHVVCPHMPFVFGAHGEPVHAATSFRMNDQDDAAPTGAGAQNVRKVYAQYYGPQVNYLSGLVKEMVNRITIESPNPPVIILQGDHGTRAGMNREELDPVRLTERLAILNAIRIPPSVVRHPSSAGLYDSITPVNTFRVLLAQLFDTSLALLKDKSYYSATYPYRLIDINDPETTPVLPVKQDRSRR